MEAYFNGMRSYTQPDNSKYKYAKAYGIQSLLAENEPVCWADYCPIPDKN